MVDLPMVTTITIIVTFGVLLMILETFVPGMIAGILGGLCVLAGIALVMTVDEFSHWPSWGRGAAALGILFSTGLILLIWLRCFATRVWHRSFTLQSSIPPAPQTQTLPPGTEGIAITELRPLGRAEFAGVRREVRCEDGFAPAGAHVFITGSEPGNLLVRLLSTPI